VIFRRSPFLIAALITTLVSLQNAVGAQPSPSIPSTSATGTASGSVHSADGTPIAGATVRLSGNGPTRTAHTDRHGDFLLANIPPGTYIITVQASGYTALHERTIQVTVSSVTHLAIDLPRAQASSLVVIGHVTANGNQTLSTSPTPTLDISTQPYAQAGVKSVSDILRDQLSTTVIPVLGGGLNAPAVVALRGPDPSETLVDVDGHQVNNGSTGDFDLSLLDPADLQSVQVVYGIAPSALYGPNTLGGAVNIRTLEPTTDPHTLLRLSSGSYDSNAETLQATGTLDGRWGYALSYHRTTSGGELDDFLIPTGEGTGVAPVSNALDATSLLGKVRYTLPNGGFFGISFRDQDVYRDLSATLSSVQTPANGAPGGTSLFSNFSGTNVESSNMAYGFDAQLPLGRPGADGTSLTTATFRHQTSTNFQTVNGPGVGTSPYLYDDNDHITDDTLQIDHVLPHALLSLKYALTNEGLVTDFIPGVVFADSVARSVLSTTSSVHTAADAIPGFSNSSQEFLSQTERSLGLLYQDDPTSKLHYSFAAYDSDYSTFGSSIDPRFGFVWTPKAESSYRVSVGSTFQSPQLPTFIVPPVLPQPVGGFVSLGNPNATAEHATSYDVGTGHIFPTLGSLRLDLDAYWTDLHNGVATIFPTTQCLPTGVAGVFTNPLTSCESFPVNVTHEVYQGLEVRGQIALAAHTMLHASYDIDSVYIKSAPPLAADNQPLFEQALGVPLHKAALDITHDTRAFSWNAGLLYEGDYNELNLTPYATVHAGVTWHFRDYDLGLYGQNLTNAYDFKLTQANGGIIYGGLTGPGNGPIPTSALPLAGRQITVSVSRKT
jgi:outer membrane receptor protein involved in Fe transport